MALGQTLKKLFKWPAWTVPAICFNNTTALPLLLVQALDTAGILEGLLKGPDDSSSAAVKRAKSYFLVASVVGNSLTFAVGPKLLDDEMTPESYEQDKIREQEEQEEVHGRDDRGRRESEEEHANPTNTAGRTAEEQEEHTNEQTSLLPHHVTRHARKIDQHTLRLWNSFPAPVKSTLSYLGQFFNAPLIGALIGLVLGIVPPFHTAFFNEPDQGGIFKAWLTTSLKNVGELFAALQLVTVGAKLAASLLKMKKGEDAGKVRLVPSLTIFFIRFVAWPLLSIGFIYVVASKTNWLDDDPVLWFVMMLLPTGCVSSFPFLSIFK